MITIEKDSGAQKLFNQQDDSVAIPAGWTKVDGALACPTGFVSVGMGSGVALICNPAPVAGPSGSAALVCPAGFKLGTDAKGNPLCLSAPAAPPAAATPTSIFGSIDTSSIKGFVGSLPLWAWGAIALGGYFAFGRSSESTHRRR